MKKRKTFREWWNGLNWNGFGITLAICAIGLTTNKSVTSFGIWAMMMLFIGVPASLFILLATGRDD
jgi:hypothetical protein